MPHLKDKPSAVCGRITLWTKDERTGILLPHCSRANQIQADWGFIAAQAIGMGNRDYRVSAMYIEFQNVIAVDVAVTAPSFESTDGIGYYDDLVSSPDTDFLRVPLSMSPALGIASGFEPFFTEGTDGNKLTFFGMTSGVAGINGKTFSESVNSKVYGAALIAAPVFADRTQDRIFARAYLQDVEQLVKAPSQQIGITWEINFLV